MGKQKRGRIKSHAAAVKPREKEKAKNEKVEIVDMLEMDTKAPSISKLVESENIFKTIKIDDKDLALKLPDFDARSCITSKSLKDLKLKKKDKQKLRHELWIKKLSAVEAAKLEAKERKRKQQTPVVGDIGALGEALPTLDLLMMGDAKKKAKTEEKPRSIPKEKKRQKQMLNDISLFQQVVQHPAYKQNPSETIKEHLQNKLKQDEGMEI